MTCFTRFCFLLTNLFDLKIQVGFSHKKENKRQIDVDVDSEWINMCLVNFICSSGFYRWLLFKWIHLVTSSKRFWLVFFFVNHWIRTRQKANERFISTENLWIDVFTSRNILSTVKMSTEYQHTSSSTKSNQWSSSNLCRWTRWIRCDYRIFSIDKRIQNISNCFKWCTT